MNTEKIEKLRTEIKESLVWVKKPMPMWNILPEKVYLLEQLADELPDGMAKYETHIAYRINYLLKTAQQKQDGTKRKDLLDDKAKRLNADLRIDALFTDRESEKTKQTKAMNSSLDIIDEIDKAEAEGDDERASKLQVKLNEVLRKERQRQAAKK
tara:strand:+ start:335 stop:799 length:465 start_codon:yes stop_codon:yes gene_type:complete